MLLQLYAYFVTESNNKFEISSAIFLVLFRNFIVTSHSIFRIIYLDAVNNRPRFVVAMKELREQQKLEYKQQLQHNINAPKRYRESTADSVWEISIQFLILYYIFVSTEFYCRFAPFIVILTKLHYALYETQNVTLFCLVVTETIIFLVVLEFLSFYYMVEFKATGKDSDDAITPSMAPYPSSNGTAGHDIKYDDAIGHIQM